MVNSHKVGRNDPCPCGSGKKFKKCCLYSQRLDEPSSGFPQIMRTPDVARSGLQDEEAMLAYDPLIEPDPDLWVALDEEERIDLVMAYHRRAGIRLPREKVHAVFHAIVESQIADPKLPVRSTAQRLMSEGLDRHEAIHAIGSVLAGHVNELMREIKSGDDNVDAKPNQDPNEAYFAELELLTADEWRRSG
ncbi:SEC-C metal-binding domain-containing protein [Bradyrhizobium sp. PMVTL-01]|uniref:SEC-C metal-binding domain-containing protein n=1 Tax=Bradyrhizobium sp. PMVTL-01 TaxID=3434999 RepID=UPI003F721BC3